MSLGDVDADGDLDAVVGTREKPSTTWLNDGHGRFFPGQELQAAGASSVTLSDIDGDGDLDAVLANRPRHVWVNNGRGKFQLSPQSVSADDPREIALADWDGDGDLDALVVNSRGRSRIWINHAEPGDVNGDGRFDQRDIVQVLQTDKYLRNVPATWIEGDFNGDGRFDQLDIALSLERGNYGGA